MSIQHRFEINNRMRFGVSIPNVVIKTGKSEVLFDEVIPDAMALYPINIKFSIANLQSVFIFSERDAMQIVTNDSTGDTFFLQPKVPLFWLSDFPAGTKPFTVDVTNFIINSANYSRLVIAILTN